MARLTKHPSLVGQDALSSGMNLPVLFNSHRVTNLVLHANVDSASSLQASGLTGTPPHHIKSVAAIEPVNLLNNLMHPSPPPASPLLSHTFSTVQNQSTGTRLGLGLSHEREVCWFPPLDKEVVRTWPCVGQELEKCGCSSFRMLGRCE